MAKQKKKAAKAPKSPPAKRKKRAPEIRTAESRVAAPPIPNGAEPEPPRAGAAALTSQQVKDLAGLLRAGAGNVYDKCRLHFGVEVGEEIFDRLEQEAGLCRCELCSVWKPKERGTLSGEPGPERSFICTACLDDDHDPLED